MELDKYNIKKFSSREEVCKVIFAKDPEDLTIAHA